MHLGGGLLGFPAGALSSAGRRHLCRLPVPRGGRGAGFRGGVAGSGGGLPQLRRHQPRRQTLPPHRLKFESLFKGSDKVHAHGRIPWVAVVFNIRGGVSRLWAPRSRLSQLLETVLYGFVPMGWISSRSFFANPPVMYMEPAMMNSANDMNCCPQHKTC